MADRIKMLIAISQRDKEKEITDHLLKTGVGVVMKFAGRGTAPSEVLDILGIGNTEKSVIVAMGKQKACEAVVRSYTDTLSSLPKGRGIMLLISPDSVSNIVANILTMTQGTADTADNGTEGEQTEMKNEHKYSLILASVNQGFTDAVMEKARSKGATGGTIVRARLFGDSISEKFKGMDLESEKEIVAILAPDTIKADIMNAINTDFGLRSEAQGILCSVPVDMAFKI